MRRTRGTRLLTPSKLSPWVIQREEAVPIRQSSFSPHFEKADLAGRRVVHPLVVGVEVKLELRYLEEHLRAGPHQESLPVVAVLPPHPAPSLARLVLLEMRPARRHLAGKLYSSRLVSLIADRSAGFTLASPALGMLSILLPQLGLL